MPILDMPLEELVKYNGINPKPSDFDEYWDKALEEMRTVEPNAEFIPAGPAFKNIICYDMYFTGTKGARIYAKLLIPKNIEGKSPAVLHFHGYSGESGDWLQYAAYAEEGYVIAAMDCRGQGGKSEDVGGVIGNTLNGHIIRGLSNDDPNDLLYRDIFLDTAMLARVVMSFDYVDENRVGCFGGSQGGALTLACASLVPEIKVAVPQFPFLCDYKRVWKMDLAKDAYAELSTYFRKFDPRHEREDEIFTRLGYIDLQFLVPRIRAKLTMFTGLMDNICPPSTQFAAYNKMVCKKNYIIYPDYGHEAFPDYETKVFEYMQQL